MTIQEQVKADLKTAMLNKDEAKKSILRVLIGEFNREGKEVSDEKATAIIKKMVVNANDMGNTSEAALLEVYLPSQMDELELKRVLMNYIMNMDSPSMKDMGIVMAYLKENYSGQYDGKLASTLVRELLA